MERFIVGDVVAVPFPFSDLSGKKLRPALILAESDHDDFILCQLTSRAVTSKKAIAISDVDFSEGNLPLRSYIRPDRLFAAEATIIKKRRGSLKPLVFNKVLQSVRQQFIDI